MADEKRKGTRTVKPVYAVMSIEDNDGKTLNVSKENVTIQDRKSVV